MDQNELCVRCHKPITGRSFYVDGYGVVCYNCAEMLAGDDDYNDPYTGDKVI
jgi:hypothetical protein